MGLFQKYTDLGIKTEEGSYKNDYKEGIWKKYNSKTGDLETETTYQNSVKNGVFKEYNKANRISIEGNYKNNEKDGIWKIYDLAGKLSKEIEYKLGREISSKEYK